MSLILDALKKADQERQHDSTPSLESQYHSSTAPQETKKTLPILALCAALALVIAGITYVLLASSTKPETDESAIAENPAATEAVQVKKENAVPVKKEKNLKAEKLIAEQYKTKIDAPSEKPAKTIQALYNDEEEIAEVIDKPIAAVKHAVKKEVARIEIAKREITDTNTNMEQLSAYSNVKLIKELPFSAQENIPTLIYSEHHYASGNKSHIVINGKKLITNSKFGPSIRIKKIVQDGLILEQDNREFKMIALNSWLNY